MNPKVKELFLNNLLLLGFDRSTFEKQGQKCDKNMFSMPNPKMFGIVTHFLFSKLKGNYPLPWPLLEKSQIKEFQKLTFTYLSSIAKESHIKFPRFTQSVISMAGKDRFYELYFAFSCHVLENCLKVKGNVELLCLPKLPSPDIKTLLKLETISSTERTHNLLRFSKLYLEQVINCSSDFCSLISSLKSNYMAKKSELDGKTKQFFSLYSENEVMNNASSLPDLIKKHLIYEKKVQKHWESLQKFLATEQELWQFLCSEIEGESVKYVLNSSLIDVSSLSVLMEEHAIHKIEEAPNEKGKPSLLRFLKLFAELLKFLLQTYQTGISSNLHTYCKLENSWCLNESQDDMIALNNKIFKSLSDIKKSTDVFQEKILPSEFSEEIEGFIKEVQNWTFCSKSFHEKVNSTRANVCLPSKNGSSLILTKATSESNSINSSMECIDISVECSPPKLDTNVESKEELLCEVVHDLKPLKDTPNDCVQTVNLSLDFGFNDSKIRLSSLNNETLLDVSLPDDDEFEDLIQIN